MNYIITRSDESAELMHYGVLGMKWGVRRYQKKDGSLTRLGKKRVDEGANLFPTYKGKHLKYMSDQSKNRDTVVDKISREKSKEDITKYERYKKRNPNFAKDANSESDRMSIWNNQIRDKNEKEETRKRYEEKFIDEYGDAVLKDLDIYVNPKTKKYVQDLIEKRELWDGIVGRRPEKFVNEEYQKKDKSCQNTSRKRRSTD